MRAATLALLAVCSLSLAQTKPDVLLPSNVHMYPPKNITPEKAPRVALSVQNLVGVGVRWDDVLQTFVLSGGTPQQIDMAEAMLKRLDIPEPRVELTVSLIRASSGAPFPQSSQPVAPIPAELKSTVEEMKRNFPYEHYSLWDSIVLLPKGNGGEVQGVLTSDFGSYTYTVTYGLYGGSPLSEGKTLNLANFNVAIKMPSAFRARGAVPSNQDPAESHIRTDVSVREGQKLVLGKIRLLPATAGDLFLVLSTKVE
jgi:hypothetical protein